MSPLDINYQLSGRSAPCFSAWQCRLQQTASVPSYIPAGLALANAASGDGRHTTATVLKYQIEYEPFMFVLIGSVLAASCERNASLGRPIFVDSGANEGLWTMLAGTLGCHVLAVEPQPGCVRWLEDSIALNPRAKQHVRVFNRFLSPDAGALLPVGETGCDGHFGSGVPGKEARPTGGDVSKGGHSIGTSVRGIRLDSLVPARHSHRRFADHLALWHIDTEGAEVLVLRSASALLLFERIDRIVLELSPRLWANHNVSLTTGYAELEQHFRGWQCWWACTGLTVDWLKEVNRVGALLRKRRWGHAGHCKRPWNKYAIAVDAYCVRAGVEPVFHPMLRVSG